jgi:serine/threonine-protein kinase
MADLTLDTATLSQLGIPNLAGLHQAYLATGAPRDADRFLAWLHSEGHLDGPALGAVHTTRPVDVHHVGRVRTNPTRSTDAEGRFDVLGTLGQGGMGTVHLARERDLRRPIALKVLSDGTSEVGVTRFLTEATITAQLDHPNIVPVYGLEHTSAGQPALSMKLVSGQTFESLVEGPTPLNQRLEYFLEVCSAMQFAHDRGVIHRDLKPENLMVGEHRDVFVVDWGIAKLVGTREMPVDDSSVPTSSATQTQAGTIVGTPAYMSPEQASGEPLGPASDQYALGLLLYELACNRRANTGKNSMVAAAWAMSGQIEPIDVGSAPRPRDIAAIIRRATAFEIDDRYPRVEALADDVRRYMRGDETQARPDNLPRRVLRWSRAHPLVLWVLLTMAIGAGGLAVVLGLTAVIGLLGQQAAREAAVGEVVSTVTHRGQELDSELTRLGGLAGGLAKAGERRWREGRPDGRLAYGREAFEAGEVPGLVDSALYGKPVTVEHVLMWRAPGLGDEVDEDALRLAPLHEAMQDVALRSVSEGAPYADADTVEALVAHEGTPATLVYVAYANGLYMEYPGAGGLAAEYDARKRPWYQGMVDVHGAAWGAPYAAASGLGVLVPCRAAMYADGEFLGVAGLTLLMDGVVEKMALPGVDGVVETYLLDASGGVVVRSSQAGQQVSAGLHDNKGVDLATFDQAEVLAAIATGETAGYIDAGDRLYVYVRMGSTDWTYVAEIAD